MDVCTRNSLVALSRDSPLLRTSHSRGHVGGTSHAPGNTGTEMINNIYMTTLREEERKKEWGEGEVFSPEKVWVCPLPVPWPVYHTR